MEEFEEHSQGTMQPDTKEWVQPLLRCMIDAMDEDDNDRIFIFMNKFVEKVIGEALEAGEGDDHSFSDHFFRNIESRWRIHMIEEVFPRWIGNDFDTISWEVEGAEPYQTYTVTGSYPPFRSSPAYPDGRDYQKQIFTVRPGDPDESYGPTVEIWQSEFKPSLEEAVQQLDSLRKSWTVLIFGNSFCSLWLSIDYCNCSSNILLSRQF